MQRAGRIVRSTRLGGLGVTLTGPWENRDHRSRPPAPYAMEKLTSQTDSVGKSVTVTIPDKAFVDDDGNATLTYSASLADGIALPTWLRFDPITRTFSGIPPEKGTVNIKVTATDPSGAAASASFDIQVL